MTPPGTAQDRQDSGEDAAALRRFSTACLPVRQRLEIWREVFGREVARLDIAPLGPSAPHCNVMFRECAGSSLGQGDVSAISCERTRDLMRDGNDDIILMVPLAGRICLDQRGSDLTAEAGEVLVRRSDDAGKTRSAAGRYLTLTLPRAMLDRRVADLDRLTMTVLPRDGEAVALLTAYARTLLSEGALPGGLATLAQTHLVDIAGVAIGAGRDAWHRAEQGGIKAARLRMLHAAIRDGARDEAFSIGPVARSLGISPGYLRKLLAAEGQSFSALVLDRRLSLAHEMLTAATGAQQTISGIALAAGFGDVSYFNRAFKRRYGATPGDILRRSRRH